MLYKALGNSGVQVSAITFGAMRFPNAEMAGQVIDRGVELGLNYIDTSTGYVGGQSEIWAGAAVARQRDKVYFSSKSNWDSAPDAQAVRASIEKSLKATGLDYFDFYQLWGLQRPEVLQSALAKGGFVEGVRKAQKDGLVRYGLGFTFHGNAELFRSAVDSGEFCCATVSYNLMHRNEEPNIAYAAGKGVGVIIMNPLAGGLLALAGDKALNFLRGPGSGPWHGAMRFLLANPGITTSLVGFTSAEEVDQAASTLSDTQSLGEDYRADLARQIDNAHFVEGNFCTGCGYCKDCPHDFNPTRFMQAMRDFAVYGVEEQKLRHWIQSKYPHQNLSEHLAQCLECEACQLKCPQHLEIVQAIRKAKAAFGVK